VEFVFTLLEMPRRRYKKEIEFKRKGYYSELMEE